MKEEKMQGRIIKGIAGFYYVQTKDGLYECKAKGIFRKEKRKPLVGDWVEIEILNETEMTGNLTDIKKRKNTLIRPEVANVDQTLLIFALESPKPNIALLDRFLLMMESQQVKTIICFNKEDLVEAGEAGSWRDIYQACGYQVLICSAKQKVGVEEVRRVLQGKTTVIAGPSGVGKSSMTNLLQEGIQMETGIISKKLKKGKHTTRHSQVIWVDDTTFLIDTPGFTSLDTIPVEKEELRFYFPEFTPYEGKCRFNGCIHVNEPDCAVKDAVGKGAIAQSRYENYKLFFEERKEKEKRRY